MFRKAIGLTGAAGLALTLGTAIQPAQAVQTSQTAACVLALGSFNAQWGQNKQIVTATAPPTVGPVLNTSNIYQSPFGVGVTPTTFTETPMTGGRTARVGKIVMGGYLYDSSAIVRSDGSLVRGSNVLKRYGGGWGGKRFLVQARYKASAASKPSRTTLYAQDTSGRFGRWTDLGTGFRNTGYVAGLSTMKAFALIATTATYDLFLVNNRAGGLYTLKIPTTSPLKPVATPVRTSSWQVFEKMIAAPCGTGSIVLAMDYDTGKKYLYVVGHANGAKTAIRNLGELTINWGDFDHFRFAPAYDPLNGG
ncbi:hypothetical protein EV137_4668 [Kribbella pratensis]|uniref:Uncharacterized protein n=1 Tax=Kribbella pratensis TaxID=2512112 RepID=A0ABY2FHH5_9ACTN|nr:hypothetical protein [Kribbella pratensis]TDW90839.1 hypothetical protein EV137_4668 [Kribbella pratensis]